MLRICKKINRYYELIASNVDFFAKYQQSIKRQKFVIHEVVEKEYTKRIF